MNPSLDFAYGEGECAPQIHYRWIPAEPRLVSVPCRGGYNSANPKFPLPDFDLAKLRRLARLGTQLDLWDERAHLWDEHGPLMVDGPYWSLDLVLGRRRYRASNHCYGARFALIHRLLGLAPARSRDYWS